MNAVIASAGSQSQSRHQDGARLNRADWKKNMATENSVRTAAKTEDGSRTDTYPKGRTDSRYKTAVMEHRKRFNARGHRMA